MTNLETFGQRPIHYGGYWPDPEDYIVYTRSRDSYLLYHSNFEVAQRRLEAACEAAGVDPYDEWPDRTWPGQEAYPIREGALILWRAKHWAAGWVEYLGVKRAAPEPVLEEARKIMRELANYPVLDDDDYAQRQAEAAQEVWDTLSDGERREVLTDAGLPADTIPDVPPLEVWEWLGVTG